MCAVIKPMLDSDKLAFCWLKCKEMASDMWSVIWPVCTYGKATRVIEVTSQFFFYFHYWAVPKYVKPQLEGCMVYIAWDRGWSLKLYTICYIDNCICHQKRSLHDLKVLAMSPVIAMHVAHTRAQKNWICHKGQDRQVQTSQLMWSTRHPQGMHTLQQECINCGLYMYCIILWTSEHNKLGFKG